MNLRVTQKQFVLAKAQLVEDIANALVKGVMQIDGNMNTAQFQVGLVVSQLKEYAVNIRAQASPNEESIKRVRDRSATSLADSREALIASGGDEDIAIAIIRKAGAQP